MPNDITWDRTVATLQVGELVELIRITVREELAGLLRDESADELVAAPPSTRDVDTIIARMQATGKYNKKFLASLRRGMERSHSFQRARAEADA